MKDIQVLNTGPFQVNTLIVRLNQNDVFVVDPAACFLTCDENKITDFLLKNNLNPKAVILTHGHFDHITGTGILKEKFPDVPLICHKSDENLVGKNAYKAQFKSLEYMGAQDIALALKNFPEPDILIEDKTELKDLLPDWNFIHTPGHTPGSCCLFNKNKSLFISGDTLFFQSYGRTDLEGGNQQLMEQSLKMIANTIPKETLVFPGHGKFGFRLEENSFLLNFIKTQF